ncbi:MAG: right-handed parallel beta-helix repeat-containing protein [Deltaproteobacteria bacterium]
MKSTAILSVVLTAILPLYFIDQAPAVVGGVYTLSDPSSCADCVESAGARLPSVKIVAPGANGDYTTIQGAVDSAVPGDIIRVIGGVYTGKIVVKNSGTRLRPITIEAYPGHKPIIVPGKGEGDRVEIDAEWIVFQGFEVMKGWDGVKLYKGNNIIRNNKIHRNTYQGILIISTDNITIENNIIESNGTGKGECYNKDWRGSSPKHCHGIYLSDFECKGISGVAIRGNVIRNHGGRGIQMNGSKCSTWIENLDIEKNLIEDNSWGMAIYHHVRNSRITNNKFILEKYPSTDDTSHTHLGIWKSSNNEIQNNYFQSANPGVAALEVFDAESADNSVDYNTWKIKSGDWKWNDSWRNDFQSQYQRTTGWDENGKIINY